MLRQFLMRGGAMLAFPAGLLPIHAAAAQTARDEPVAGGLRIEAFVGADTDGFERGVVYGGRVGYDVPIASSMMLGLDAELSDVSTDQEFAGSPIVLEDGPDYYAGGRITVRLARWLSLVGGVGYTRARQGAFFLIDPHQPQGPVGGEATYRDGYRITLGAQLNVSRRMFLGTEYRYSDYDDPAFRRGQWVGSVGFRF